MAQALARGAAAAAKMMRRSDACWASGGAARLALYSQAMAAPLSLDSYRLLGRSGLRVSPLALGTMTFGAAWGSEEGESRRIFDAYVECGGNFIDTAGH